MFSIIVKRLPWRGREVQASLEAGGREGARRAAEFVADRARAYAPVRTGKLRDSIVVTSSMGGAVWNVMATAPYSKAVEFGHLQGNTFVAPNPFLRKAMADGRREYPQLLKSAMVTAKSGQHLGASFAV